MLVENIFPCMGNLSQIIFIYVLVNEKNNSHLLMLDSSTTMCAGYSIKADPFQAIKNDIDVCTNDSRLWIFSVSIPKSTLIPFLFNIVIRDKIIEKCNQNFFIFVKVKRKQWTDTKLMAA